MQDHRTETAYWALRLTFGVVPIVAGLDKFTNLLANWEGYLSPLAVRLLPVAPHTFMMAVGIVEIAVGVGVLSGRARVFGWVAAGWLLAIAVNLRRPGGTSTSRPATWRSPSRPSRSRSSPRPTSRRRSGGCGRRARPRSMLERSGVSGGAGIAPPRR